MTTHDNMRMIETMASRHGILTERSLGRQEILGRPALQIKNGNFVFQISSVHRFRTGAASEKIVLRHFINDVIDADMCNLF